MDLDTFIKTESLLSDNTDIDEKFIREWVRVIVTPDTFYFNDFVNAFQEAEKKKAFELEFELKDTNKSTLVNPVFAIFKIRINWIDENITGDILYKKLFINQPEPSVYETETVNKFLRKENEL